jgi:hypothetical protein
MYCVTPHECAANPQRGVAHGNVIYVDHCRCGAARQMESNGGRHNYGPWVDVESGDEDEADLRRAHESEREGGAIPLRQYIEERRK